jgi:hypothetical protein
MKGCYRLLPKPIWFDKTFGRENVYEIYRTAPIAKTVETVDMYLRLVPSGWEATCADWRRRSSAGNFAARNRARRQADFGHG